MIVNDSTISDEVLTIAAKRLCVIRGIDPEEMQVMPSSESLAVVRKTKAWCNARNEIRTQMQITAALEFALGEKK